MKKINVLIIGGGGREHALVEKLSDSPLLGKLYVTPGNGGTCGFAENVSIKPTDTYGLLVFAREKNIELTIVGPEAPLAAGIVDVFQANGLKIFGPTKEAARIETSKAFSKKLMKKLGISTPSHEVFEDFDKASEYVRRHFEDSHPPKLVVKASGLAGGKGVVICSTLNETLCALDQMMVQCIYGDAGVPVIIEECVSGPERSFHFLCDGNRLEGFPSAQDYKALCEGGPNTGGMGAIAPATEGTQREMVNHAVYSIVAKMKENGHPFTGLLYPGVVMSPTGPQILEFNARFGDPETQVYMRLLKSDLLEVLLACVEERLDEVSLEWHSGYAACVVLASPGYPGKYETGSPITGIDRAERVDGVRVFHAGTVLEGSTLKTAGGRVLSVTAVSGTLPEALNCAYRAIKCIHFKGMQYRKDIGATYI